MEKEFDNVGHIIAVNDLLKKVVDAHMECIAAAKDISFAKTGNDAVGHIVRSSEAMKDLGNLYMVLFNVLKQHEE